MLVELHLLQSFPVSNLNRDDIGQPKTASFGGHTRGRISSQSLKRAARQLFSGYGLDITETGVRTKRLLDNAVDVLVERGRDRAEAVLVVTAGLEAIGFGVNEATGRTQYLLFVGRAAVNELADYCDGNWADLQAKASAKRAAPAKDDDTAPAQKTKKAKPDKQGLDAARRILDARRVADIALFGRMIADNKDFSVDAASQVAHALSTHAVTNEFDYYTAVDDLKLDDESGADMIGTVDFNTATYYRYANVDLEQLTANLSGDVELAHRATHAWLQAFINAVPGGKQNSMAARTMPDTLVGVVRDRGAWNLANAFLTPVTGGDLMAESTARLLNHLDRLRGFYGAAEIRSVTAASVSGNLADAIAEEETAATLEAFTDRVLTATRA